MPVTYEQWKKETSSLFSTRSKELKAVDAAFIAYETGGRTDDQRETLMFKLDAWRSVKGEDWRTSRRNRSGIVEQLWAELAEPEGVKLPPEEQDALKVIADHQREAVRLLFEGKKIVIRPDVKKQMKEDAKSAYEQMKAAASRIRLPRIPMPPMPSVRLPSLPSISLPRVPVLSLPRIHLGLPDFPLPPVSWPEFDLPGIDFPALKFPNFGLPAIPGISMPSIDIPNVALPGVNLRGIARDLWDAILALTDGLDPKFVLAELGLGMVDVFTTAVPFLGSIKEGAKLLGKIRETGKHVWARYKTGKATSSFRPGNAAAALEGVKTVLERLIAYDVEQTVTTGVNFAGTLTFVGGGAAKTATSLVDLLTRVVQFTRDFREVRKANALLQSGNIDLNIFKVCPLLGAYYILLVDDFAIMNLAMHQFGQPGWQFEAERLKQKLLPAQRAAGECVRKSRHVIPEYEEVRFAKKTGTQEKVVKRLKGLFAR